MHFCSVKEDMKCSFAQTYSLKKGFKKFRQRGKDRACKEMNQSYNRIMFEPVRLEDLNQDKIDKAMKSLMILAKKRDRTIKENMHTNSSTQQEHVPEEVASSLTVAKESALITGVVEAK